MTTATPEAQVEFHLPTPNKELIEQAAVLSGQSVAEFAVSTLTECARQIVQQQSVRVLSRRDAERFLALLDAEAAPNDALRAAATRFKGRHG